MPFDIKEALESDATTIVLSFGSAGADKQQQCPGFSVKMGDTERVDVLNFDPGFPNTSNEMIGKTKIHFYNQPVNEKLQTELNRLVKKWIESGKKVILLEHRAPIFDPFIIKLGKEYNSKIGTQIEFIGSYFQDIPVFIYNKNLFNLDHQQSINQTLLNIWRNWRDRNDETLREQQYNVFSTKQLQQWREQCNSIGILYRNLKSIPKEDLFSPNAVPKPIIGLSEQEYEVAFQKRIKSLKEPLEVAAFMLKQGEIERFKQYVTANFEVLKIPNKFGRTLAHIAVIDNISDDPSIIAFLKSKQIDFFLPDKHGSSPLEFTAWNGGVRVTAALIGMGAHKTLSPQKLLEIVKDAREGGRFDVAQTIEQTIDDAKIVKAPMTAAFTAAAMQPVQTDIKKKNDQPGANATTTATAAAPAPQPKNNSSPSTKGAF